MIIYIFGICSRERDPCENRDRTELEYTYHVPWNDGSGQGAMAKR